MSDPHKVVPKVKGLNCPGCGSALTIRSMGRAVSVVCPACLRVLDAQDPNLKILSTFQGNQRVIPVIPLGKRGGEEGVVVVNDVADDDFWFHGVSPCSCFLALGA